MYKMSKLDIDLHTHSIFSDGSSTLYQIEEKAKREGIGIALTDHNEIRGSVRLFENQKIISIPAIEAGTREGLEFLIYFQNPADLEEFYKRAIEPNRKFRYMVQINISTEELLRVANEYLTFISLAHPYGFWKKSINYHIQNEKLIKTIMDGIDSVEIYNGNLSDKVNNFAFDLFSQYENLAMTVGSDAHNIESFGKVTAKFIFDKNNPHLFDGFLQLVENNLQIDTKSSISKFKTMYNIALNHSRYYIDGGTYKNKIIINELKEDKYLNKA